MESSESVIWKFIGTIVLRFLSIFAKKNNSVPFNNCFDDYIFNFDQVSLTYHRDMPLKMALIPPKSVREEAIECLHLIAYITMRSIPWMIVDVVRQTMVNSGRMFMRKCSMVILIPPN